MRGIPPIRSRRGPRRHRPAKLPRIVPPCGVCRELLADHLTGGRAVIASAPDTALLVAVDELLPHKYIGTKWTTANHLGGTS
ncbi:hypothetical protein [Streptomyces sp. NPDC093111]|uniref:hypothetical protein n=1 Tax=Streptomyces sp. NPDC093111 TaxID=3154978 RepID=UPI00342A6A66